MLERQIFRKTASEDVFEDLERRYSEIEDGGLEEEKSDEIQSIGCSILENVRTDKEKI